MCISRYRCWSLDNCWFEVLKHNKLWLSLKIYFLKSQLYINTATKISLSIQYSFFKKVCLFERERERERLGVGGGTEEKGQADCTECRAGGGGVRAWSLRSWPEPKTKSLMLNWLNYPGSPLHPTFCDSHHDSEPIFAFKRAMAWALLPERVNHVQ